MCKCGKIATGPEPDTPVVTKVSIKCVNCTTSLRSRIGIPYPVHLQFVNVSDYIVREWEQQGYEFIYQ